MDTGKVGDGQSEQEKLGGGWTLGVPNDTDQSSLISALQGPEGELWVLKAAAQPHLTLSESPTSFHRLDCPLLPTVGSAGRISAITSPTWILL